MARGLGLYRIVAAFLEMFCGNDAPAVSQSMKQDEEGQRRLVLTINCNGLEELFMDALLSRGVPQENLPLLITNEVSTRRREELYRMGGVYLVTSRILVVDMLNKVVDVSSIGGLLVGRANRVVDSSTEAFILRLFRQGNKNGFVMAFSDDPEAFQSGFARPEKVLRALKIRKIHLWPRNHLLVVDDLARREPVVEEYLVPMSQSMINIQNCVCRALHVILKEIRNSAPALRDVETLSIQSYVNSNFVPALLLRANEASISLSRRTRRLLNDVQILRQLLDCVAQYDCVTFLSFLRTLQSANSLQSDPSPWLLMDEADELFFQARNRVYKVLLKKGEGVLPSVMTVDREGGAEKEAKSYRLVKVLEENSKWSVLKKILKKIKEEGARIGGGESSKSHRIGFHGSGAADARVVLVVKDSYTLNQLKEYLCLGGDEMMEQQFWRFVSEANERTTRIDQRMGNYSNRGRQGKGEGDIHDAGEQRRQRQQVEEESVVKIDEISERETKNEEGSVKGGGATTTQGSNSNNDMPSPSSSASRGGRNVVSIERGKGSSNTTQIGSVSCYSSLKEDNSVTQKPKFTVLEEEEEDKQPRSRCHVSNPYAPRENLGRLRKEGEVEQVGGEEDGGMLVPDAKAADGGTASSPYLVGFTRKHPNPNRCASSFPYLGAKRVTIRASEVEKVLLKQEGKRLRKRSPSPASSISPIVINVDGAEQQPIEIAHDEAKTVAREGIRSAKSKKQRLGNKRRRVESGGATLEIDDSKLLEERGGDSVTEPSFSCEVMEGMHIMVYTALEAKGRIFLMKDLKPTHIILYDPDLSTLRQVEVYTASLSECQPVPRVYFLMYDGGVDAERYQSAVRVERKAFDQLIEARAHMSIGDIDAEEAGRSVIPPPLSMDTRTVVNHSSSRYRLATRDKSPRKIVVDVREFRSALPLHLHGRNCFELIPATISVGDYVLTPAICVERKSLADLFSSFNSGRLFTQCEAMSQYYEVPVLLIEFAAEKKFMLQLSDDIGDDISTKNITTKLSMLVLHFPRLRILWSRSPLQTVDLFEKLTKGCPPVNIEKALSIGSTGAMSEELQEGRLNRLSVDFLLKLPGVNERNFRALMRATTCVSGIQRMERDRLNNAMGERNAERLHKFLVQKTMC